MQLYYWQSIVLHPYNIFWIHICQLSSRSNKTKDGLLWSYRSLYKQFLSWMSVFISQANDKRRQHRWHTKRMGCLGNPKMAKLCQLANVYTWQMLTQYVNWCWTGILQHLRQLWYDSLTQCRQRLQSLKTKPSTTYSYVIDSTIINPTV